VLMVIVVIAVVVVLIPKGCQGMITVSFQIFYFRLALCYPRSCCSILVNSFNTKVNTSPNGNLCKSSLHITI